MTALSVAIASLYWRTKGSLPLTLLMHAAIDNTTGIVPAGAPAANLGAEYVARGVAHCRITVDCRRVLPRSSEQPIPSVYVKSR